MHLDERVAAATDRRGRLRVSGIHDSRLSILSLESGRRLCFELTAVDGRQTNFVLDALYMLNIGSLWEGVIVDSISVWRVTGRVEAGLEPDPARAWAALLAGRVSEGGERLEIERLKRRHHQLTLVELSCSYGGELQALCRDVLVDDREVTLD